MNQITLSTIDFLNDVSREDLAALVHDAWEVHDFFIHALEAFDNHTGIDAKVQEENIWELYPEDKYWLKLTLRVFKDAQIVDRIQSRISEFIQNSNYGRQYWESGTAEIIEEFLTNWRTLARLKEIIPQFLTQYKANYIELNNYFIIRSRGDLPDDILKIVGMYVQS